MSIGININTRIMQNAFESRPSTLIKVTYMKECIGLNEEFHSCTRQPNVKCITGS